jgi:Protein of unknown function (DUF3168)
MRIYQALYKYLQTVAGVTALVSTRVYDAHADQGRATGYPCIVIETIDDMRFHQIGAAPTATRRPVALYCIAQGNLKAAEDLADLVYAAIINQQDAITAAAGLLTVKSTHLNTRRNEFEDDLEMSQKLYSVVLEFDIIHGV